MKSILLAPIQSSTYSSEGLINAFRREFDEVSVFNWQNAKLHEGKEGMQQRLITKADSEKPDIIFLQMQNPEALDTSTASILAEIGFVVNYTFDVRDDIEWYKNIGRYIGLTLFGDMISVNRYKRESGKNNVDYLPSSADFNIYKPLNLNGKKDPDCPEIIFIGGRYDNTSLNFPLAKHRVEMVEFMQDTFGGKFKAYGMGWVKGSPHINPQQEVMLYNSAKCAITHNQFYSPGYSSDRIWRSLGCGCATVSHYFVGINQQFNPHVISTWIDFDMLKEECQKFLDNKEYRINKGQAGAQWVRDHHSWGNRISELKRLILKHGYKAKTLQ